VETLPPNPNTHLRILYEKYEQSQVQCRMSVIPATWEAEAGESGVQDQLEKS
jgi:hypothetical protein